MKATINKGWVCRTDVASRTGGAEKHRLCQSGRRVLEDPDGSGSRRSAGFSGFLRRFFHPAPSTGVFSLDVSAGTMKPPSDRDSVTGSGRAPPPPPPPPLTGSSDQPGGGPISHSLFFSPTKTPRTSPPPPTQSSPFHSPPFSIRLTNSICRPFSTFSQLKVACRCRSGAHKHPPASTSSLATIAGAARSLQSLAGSLITITWPEWSIAPLIRICARAPARSPVRIPASAKSFGKCDNVQQRRDGAQAEAKFTTHLWRRDACPDLKPASPLRSLCADTVLHNTLSGYWGRVGGGVDRKQHK